MNFLSRLFGSTQRGYEAPGAVPLYLSNTLTGKRDLFVPLAHKVKMYNCGPTVYHYAHIGNLRSYVFADVLRRTLEWNGYHVEQIINITDVGHLTSDSDTGNDKLEEGARREHKSVQDIAHHYTDAFFADLDALNIPRSRITFPRATDHIAEQITLIQKLETGGHTYRTSDGIYFDTSTFPNYGKLGHVHLEEDTESRIGVNAEKRHHTDFALWKFSKPEDKREQEWPSPWGVGFPGWHIECSAMSMKYLGETLDIHTGGIDHIPVHHNNEIAQSEAATGKPLARFWLHNGFVSVASGEKMAKSEGNFVRLETVREKGVDPLAFRYWLLTAHYSSPLLFSWEALLAAQTAYKKLIRTLALYGNKHGKVQESLKKHFSEIINNDLDTPSAIAHIWHIIKESKTTTSPAHVRATIAAYDTVLGLNLIARANALVDEMSRVPAPIRELGHEREQLRKKGDWAGADALRAKIAQAGYVVEDAGDHSLLMPKDAF